MASFDPVELQKAADFQGIERRRKCFKLPVHSGGVQLGCPGDDLQPSRRQSRGAKIAGAI